MGHLFALTAWKHLCLRDVPVFNRFFLRAMAWSVFCFVPVAGYFYYAYPDWSLVYLVEPGGLPAWLGPAIFSAYAGGMFFGFLTAQYFITHALLLPFLGSLAFAAFLNVAMFAATWDPYLHLGTVARYHAGQAGRIFDDSAFMLRMNLGGATMVLGALLVAWLNLREPAPPDPGPSPRRLPPRPHLD